jgi:type II secretory pathway pseudopilin PulG
MAEMKLRGFAPGFTVIELMLFLGITGVLFAALMVGVNTNITQERYREGVQAYSALLQDQYSEVTNTRNDRSDQWQCVSGAVAPQPVNGEARGTTSCVILGRAVQIQSDGTEVKTAAVIGIEPLQQDNASDIDTLAAYKPKLAESFGAATTTLDWQSSLATTDKKSSTASFLILRSPASGLLRVFASSSSLPGDLSTMITASAATTVIKNCVTGSTGLLPTQSVSVDPRVSGPNGVIVKEVDDAC